MSRRNKPGKNNTHRLAEMWAREGKAAAVEIKTPCPWCDGVGTVEHVCKHDCKKCAGSGTVKAKEIITDVEP